MMPADVMRRVLDERHELYRRLLALDAFIDGRPLQVVDMPEFMRLTDQRLAMATYLSILDQRLAAGGYHDVTGETAQSGTPEPIAPASGEEVDEEPAAEPQSTATSSVPDPERSVYVDNT